MDLIYLGCAVFVTARYIAAETISQDLRDNFTVKALTNPGRAPKLKRWLAKLINCVVCVGFWVGIVFGLYLYGWPWGWSKAELTIVVGSNAVTFLGQFVAGISDAAMKRASK